MSKILRVYLDMDGVCANFVEGACEAFGRDYDKVIQNWEKGQYDMVKVLDLKDEATLWEIIDYSRNGEFWRSLNPYPWFDRITNLLDQSGALWYFASSPSKATHSSMMKLEWINRWCPRRSTNYILTHHKHLLAQPNTLLIDDSDMNCSKYIESGGEALVFPQPWNNNTRTVEEFFEILSMRLSAL